jgi:NAD(P)H dehydrogenase (quinone)
MSYVITGATGHLGRRVVEHLLERGVDPNEIIATGRDLTKVADLADRGVRTAVADYDDPASLRTAISAGDKVLLVSGPSFGSRVQQHGNVVEAAKEAGVALLAYTSIVNAGSTDIALAQEHQGTEQVIVESGVPYALLRNSLYLEVFTGELSTYLEHGAVLGAARDGRLSAVARDDLAEAAAVVLLSDDAAGKVFELAGDQAFTFEEFAATVSDVTGQAVGYQDLTEAAYAQALQGAGVPEPYAVILADTQRGIAEGKLYQPGGELSRLLGRPTTPLADALRAELVPAGQG